MTATIGRPRARPDHDESVRLLLRQGAIRPVFQPVVRVTDGEIVGYEALSRSDVCPLPTAAWFPLARAADLTADLELACLEAVAGHGAPPPSTTLFVNLSTATLRDPRAAGVLDRLPDRLVIELSEQEEIDDMGRVRRDLEALSARGIRFAIDDTGAGHANLQRIVDLLPEYVKLDRKLIDGIDGDRVRQALVAALVAFARETGINIIAEGVERRAELHWLQAAGVPLAQGFLLGRPHPAFPEGESHLWAVPDAAVTADELDDRLGRARSQREACEAVVDHLFRQGGLMPSIYLEAAGRLRCQAQRGLWQVLDGMSPDAGITGQAFRTGAAVLLEDVRESADYLEAIPGVRSELCLPVVIDGEVRGALNVESLARLNAEEIDEVERCTRLLGDRLAGLPMEGTRVTLRRLARSATALVAARDPGQTIAAVLAGAVELAEMDSALVVLRDPATGELRAPDAIGPLARALRAAGTDELEDLWQRLGPLSSCYSSPETTGRCFVGTEALRRAGARATVALPLSAGQERTGILIVASAAPRAVGPDLVEPLELLAVLAGSCIEASASVLALRDEARRDALTGLGNHSGFHQTIGEFGPDDRPAVVMLDIDRFKTVNDGRGHLHGDQVLRATAHAMRDVLRSHRLGPVTRLFRIGGDELAAVIDESDARGAASLAGTLRRATELVLEPEGAGMSAGWAAREPGESLLDLVARADAVLYADKRRGQLRSHDNRSVTGDVWRARIGSQPRRRVDPKGSQDLP
jgi:diguanylate cyclase (GGDEF)-like protein